MKKTLNGFLVILAISFFPLQGFAWQENLNFKMDTKEWTQISSHHSGESGAMAFVPVGQDGDDWKERFIYSSSPMKKIMTSEMLYEIFTADFKEDPSTCSMIEKEEKSILFQCIAKGNGQLPDITEIRRVILGKEVIHTLRYTYRVLITDQRRSEMIEKLKSAQVSVSGS